jgi:hypothetical protein
LVAISQAAYGILSNSISLIESHPTINVKTIN